MGKDMICKNCGQELNENAKFCVYCGTETAASKAELNLDAPSKGNNKICLPIIIIAGAGFLIVIAIIIAIIFGIISHNRQEAITSISYDYEIEQTDDTSENILDETDSNDDMISNNDIDEDIDISSEYILATSDTSLLSNEDLMHYTEEELRIARNEIYARHGLIFQSEDLSTHFSNTSWYNGTVSSTSEINLSSTEKQNIEIIQAFETSASIGNSTTVNVFYVDKFSVSDNLLTLVCDAGSFNTGTYTSFTDTYETFTFPVSNDCTYTHQYVDNTADSLTYDSMKSTLETARTNYLNGNDDGEVFLCFTLDNGIITSVYFLSA